MEQKLEKVLSTLDKFRITEGRIMEVLFIYCTMECRQVLILQKPC